MPKRMLQCLLTAAIAFFMIAGSASAETLSKLGDGLPWGNVSAGKVIVQDMVRTDQGVQAFIKSRNNRITMQGQRSAVVTKLTYGYCVVGKSARCKYNTGKRGSTVVLTSYRHGQKRQVAYCEILVNGVTYKITVHVLSQNLMFVQFERKLKHKPKKIKVDNRKKIVYKRVPAPTVNVNVCNAVVNGSGTAMACNTINVTTVHNVTYAYCSNVNTGTSAWYVIQGVDCSTAIQPCGCQPPQTCPDCDDGKDGTTIPGGADPSNQGPGSGGTPSGTATGNPSTPTLGECQWRDGNDNLQLGYNQPNGTCGPNRP